MSCEPGIGLRCKSSSPLHGWSGQWFNVEARVPRPVADTVEMTTTCIDDNVHMEVQLEMMLEDHRKEPLASRWFALGAMLASHGYNVMGYEADYFYAECKDAATGKISASFIVEVDDDGKADWTYCSPYGVGLGEVEDLDDLQEESGRIETWFDVPGDLVLLWHGS